MPLFPAATVSGQYLCPPTQYAPGTLTSLSTTSGTYSAVSSANVNTGSFIAPPSGSVLVTTSFVCNQATATSTIGFALAPHGSISPLGNAWQSTLANNSVNEAGAIQFLPTGLTPGASYNFDLMFANNSTNALTITAQAFTAGTVTSTKAGPVIMTVEAV